MKSNNSKTFSIETGSNNKFGNGTVIGNNNEVTINQNNATSVTYEGDTENVFVLKIISPFLIKRYGKKNIGIVSLISLISGLITIFSWINSRVTVQSIPYVPVFSFSNSNGFLYFGIFLLFFGALLVSILFYHRNTKCKKCKKEFAYEEYKDPLVEEIKTSDGTRKTTTRSYKCKFCGHEDIRKDTEILEDKVKQ